MCVRDRARMKIVEDAHRQAGSGGSRRGVDGVLRRHRAL